MKITFTSELQPYKPLVAVSKEPSCVKFEDQSAVISDSLQALSNYGKYLTFKGHSDSLKLIDAAKPKPPVGPKLLALRGEMSKNDLDLLIVRSTDEYLNETVDKNQSQRIYISNFTGSAGDIVIGPDKAHLIVDGRYHTQADQEVDHKYYKVEKVGIDDQGEKIKDSPFERMVNVLIKLSKNKEIKVGYDPNKYSVYEIRRLRETLADRGAKIELVATGDNLVDKIRGGKPPAKAVALRSIPASLTGETPSSKHQRLYTKMQNQGLDALVVTALGDIAYITDLRGKDIDYSAVFKSKAFVTKDKIYVFCDPVKITQEIKDKADKIIEFRPESDFGKVVNNFVDSDNKQVSIGYSASSTTEATYKDLKQLQNDNVKLLEISNDPVGEMRAIKNDVELKSMQDSCNRADRAIADVIDWVNQQIKEGNTITEKDLENKVRESHFKHGANDLSFEIIPASGANGAIVHYSQGDPNKKITAGELVLLDTGGYYAPGYATDLTRTWLAGGDLGVKALEEKDIEDLKKKKEIYTTVLKASIQGLNADLPPGADGKYLDELVRAVIRERGYEKLFNHSTGHGIGIEVHEGPPYITPSNAGRDALQEGMIFSIEPGIYIPDWGGVRFENLVTIEKHPDPEKSREGWHKVKCLTFAPLDQYLIEDSILSDKDREWIEGFNKLVEQVMSEKDC